MKPLTVGTWASDDESKRLAKLSDRDVLLESIVAGLRERARIKDGRRYRSMSKKRRVLL
jgi:hypothetical protein